MKADAVTTFGQFGWGEPVRAQQERAPGWRAAAATISSTLVMPTSRANWSQSPPGSGMRGVEPLPERPGVRLQEDVHDLLAPSARPPRIWAR